VLQWWVFVHLVGVFGFLISHGVSMYITFELRATRDPKRMVTLLELSASSIRAFYWSLGLLLLGGIAAGFVGHFWTRAWIWAAILILVAVSIAMTRMARPYYRRVGLVARAMAGGSAAVSEDELTAIVRGRRPWVIAGIGFVGLLSILYLMMFQPGLGIHLKRSAAAVAADVTVSANNLKFDAKTLSAPSGRPFTLKFVNKEAVTHNVAIYTDSSLSHQLFKGAGVSNDTVVYNVTALQPGTYYFVCTYHPGLMFGTINVR